MAKIKKFADGGLSSLGGMIPKSLLPEGYDGSGFGGNFGGGFGGGNAQDGLSQVNQGSKQIGQSLNQASQSLSQAGSAIGGDGGVPTTQETPMYKKGGSVSAKKYIEKGGRLNLNSGGVSTAQKNKKNSNW